MPRVSRFILIFLLAPLTAFSAAPGPRALDEVSGCGYGKATEQSKSFCTNYTELPTFLQDSYIKDAYAKCQAFYETALRLQNTFCSYSTDAVVFKITAPSVQQAQVVGEANVSQQAAADDNKTVANINDVYMKKIAELAVKLKQNYANYSVAIGKFNSQAMNDEFMESRCAPQSVRGQVPGTLRRLLATVSQSTGHLTYQSMFASARTNYGKLKAVKATAESNSGLAKMNAINSGQVIKDIVEEPVPPPVDDGKIKLDSGLDNFVSANGAQGTLQVITAVLKPHWVPGAGIVGGVITLVYNEANGKPIKFSDTAISIISCLGVPGMVAGAALTVVNYQIKAEMANLAKYQDFARGKLRSSNGAITSMQLVDAWGDATSDDKCRKAAAQEAACIETRKTMQPYEHNSCSLSPLMDMPEPPGWRTGPLPPGY